MPVEELLIRMDSREVAEWRAYLKIKGQAQKDHMERAQLLRAAKGKKRMRR